MFFKIEDLKKERKEIYVSEKSFQRSVLYTTGIFMGRSYFWKILSIQKDPKLVFLPNLGFQKKKQFIIIFFG